MSHLAVIVILLFVLGVIVRCQEEIVRCTASSPDPSGGTNTLGCPDSLSFRFSYTGSPQTFSVPEFCGLPQPPPTEETGPPPEPPSICIFEVDMCAGQGGSWGGLGGYVQATISALPLSTLNIYVGGWGQQFNGGGSSGSRTQPGMGGGGASDVRTGSDLESRLVIAGGGGAGGNCDPVCYGGAGGGFIGGKGQYDAEYPPNVEPNGFGGTQATGGRCGIPIPGGSKEAASGALGQGGASQGGGAGGGGYYGGGSSWGAGGGGSSSNTLGTVMNVNTQGDPRCRGNGVVYLTPQKTTEMPTGGLVAPLEPTLSHPCTLPTGPQSSGPPDQPRNPPRSPPGSPRRSPRKSPASCLIEFVKSRAV